ncbi:GCN5-related N-acetyltransferase [Rippkaea orientalis PCC 8801]|uniref:GCN5-related N-acetyltransferase n=1 Tax=Rippkaea orientalis (strain PCC 8801 / RF-1) TaxID=41431 RepID=B7JYU2_RIPO1|nr:GNAT family N-acetyltransferase [Rippkaea orientalis]ACK66019.1 GCN5-related N-acetyltransferase [Rippkaea orientalis PCC 8801]
MVVQSVKLPIAKAIAKQLLNISNQSIILREAQFPQDNLFLLDVYSSTREDVQVVIDWTQEQKTAFIQMQFNAQHSYYQEHYSEAEFLIITVENIPVGRLYIERWDKEFRIIDIALLASHRQQLIGSSLLKAILMIAQEEGLAVTIHVENYNRAMNLYHRLGFRKIGNCGLYDLMEWLPSSSVNNQ